MRPASSRARRRVVDGGVDDVAHLADARVELLAEEHDPEHGLLHLLAGRGVHDGHVDVLEAGQRVAARDAVQHALHLLHALHGQHAGDEVAQLVLVVSPASLVVVLLVVQQPPVLLSARVGVLLQALRHLADAHGLCDAQHVLALDELADLALVVLLEAGGQHELLLDGVEEGLDVVHEVGRFDLLRYLVLGRHQHAAPLHLLAERRELLLPVEDVLQPLLVLQVLLGRSGGGGLSGQLREEKEGRGI